MNTLESITKQMNILEQDIEREQQYIVQHGELNDLNTDEQWEQYKENAERNLQKWDELKSMRDELKC